MKAHVSDAKKKIVKEIVDLISRHNIIGAVDMENLPAPQLQKMREQLRDKLTIFMTKRRIMKIAIEKAKEKKQGIEQLMPHLTGMPALIFTNENPFKLYKTLKQSKSQAPAKAGQTSPKDITIPAGPTSFMPGPIIGELGALGIKCGVEGGKVAVKEDSVVVREGEVIKPKVAELLLRFNIQPMEVGLNVTATYENGVIFGKDVLDIDEEKFNADLRSAISGAFNLAIYTGYPTKDTIEPLLAKAFREAKALGLSQNIIDDKIIGDLLAKAERGMLGLKSTANIETAAKPAEAPKPEEKAVEVKPATEIEEKKEMPLEEKKEMPIEEKKETPPVEKKEEKPIEEKKEEVIKEMKEEAKEIKKDIDELAKKVEEKEPEKKEEIKEVAKELKKEVELEEKQVEKEIKVDAKIAEKVEEKRELEKPVKPEIMGTVFPKEEEEIKEVRKDAEVAIKEIKKEEKKEEAKALPEEKERIEKAAEILKKEVEKEEKQVEKELKTEDKTAKMVEQMKKHIKGTTPTAQSLLKEVEAAPKPQPKPEPRPQPKREHVPTIEELRKGQGKKAPKLGITDVQGSTAKESQKSSEDVPSIQELAKQKEKKEAKDVEELAKKLVKKGTLRR